MANRPYVINSFDTPVGILMFPDNYQAKAVTLLPTDANVKEVEGRKIIKAGTIWPTNDANAQGVILNDVDVTDGAANAALLFEGSIKASKLPAQPNAAAKTALPRITFFGAVATSATAVTITGMTAPVKAATPVAKSALAVTGGVCKIADFKWEPADATFAASTEYKGIVVLVPKDGETFAQALTVTIAGATVATKVNASGTEAIVTATFPATAA